MNTKIKNLLTLATKSGNVVSGEYLCMDCLKKDTIHLLIIAKNASDNTKKKFKDKAFYHNTPIQFWQEKNSLGNIIGKSPRAVVGIIDKSFAQKLIKYFDELYIVE